MNGAEARVNLSNPLLALNYALVTLPGSAYLSPHLQSALVWIRKPFATTHGRINQGRFKSRFSSVTEPRWRQVRVTVGLPTLNRPARRLRRCGS